jgi:serine/threonine-protein kinase
MDAPEKIGRYRILSELGRGAMGIVYRGEDEDLERPVAAKMLPPHFLDNPEQAKRFRLEAKIVARLDHPNIMRVYAIEKTHDTIWIIMEYLEGRPLSDLIRESGTLPAETCIRIVTQMASALGYAHKKGIVHRDIKPMNVMISPEGQVKLMDFGIARDAESDLHLTRTGTIIGTPKYMSPEQFQGRGVDYRSDVYSLGVVAYEMACGEVPFEGRDLVEIAFKHLNEKPPPLRKKIPGLPPELAAFIHQCLSKKKEDRPADLAGVRLTPFEADTLMVRAPAQSRRFRKIALAAAVLLVSAAAAFFFRADFFSRQSVPAGNAAKPSPPKAPPSASPPAVLPAESPGTAPARRARPETLESPPRKPSPPKTSASPERPAASPASENDSRPAEASSDTASRKPVRRKTPDPLPAPVTTSPPKTDPAVSKLLVQIESGDYEKIRNAAKTMIRTRNFDPKLTGLLADLVERYLESPLDEALAVDAMAWCAKALGHSGKMRYVSLLRNIRTAPVSEKLKSHAANALETLSQSTPRYSTDEERRIAELRSESPVLVKNAAVEIVRSERYTPKILSALSAVLDRYVEKPKTDEITVDAVSWCCRALGKSGNKEFLPVLRALRDSTSLPKKIRKHAREAHGELEGKGKIERFFNRFAKKK